MNGTEINKTINSNKYNTYNFPMKQNNGLKKHSYTYRASNRQFRSPSNTLFTRTELLNLINKAIHFLYDMKQKSFIENTNKKGTRKYNLFNVQPIYKKLMSRVPVMSIAVQRGDKYPIIKFSPTKIYKCLSTVNCIDDSAIDLMEIKCEIVNGVDVAFFIYDGDEITVIAKEPTFMNSLSEKEQAFMKLIFDNANVLTNEGFRLNGYTTENIREHLNVIVNKNRTSRLRFSNKVHIKEIPNRHTLKQMVKINRKNQA